MEYEFTLTYQLESTDSDADALVERLGAFGCDDALVGIGQPGRIALRFVRAADTAHEAMTSALADIERALPSARMIEAAPDLVGITDVAELTGVTRQNIRKLLVNHPDTAPLPVHAGTPALWHLTDMLAWLEARIGYGYDARMYEMARVAEQVNITRERARGVGALAVRATCDEDSLQVGLADGRRISVPTCWFPRLQRATQEQRDRWRLTGGGTGIHWPELDEDVSVAGLLAGEDARL
jgi:hypothetical protein